MLYKGKMFLTLFRSLASQSKLFRSFHSSALSRLKQILVEKKNDNTTVVDCKHIQSPREPYLLKLDRKDGKCPLCALKLDLKHTDVLILCQYMDSNGNIFKLKDTNLCWDQYKLVKELIYMAQYAGLLPEPPREEPKKPYQLLNTYYDESTIILRPKYKKFNMKFHYLSKRLGPIEKFRINPSLGTYYGRIID